MCIHDTLTQQFINGLKSYCISLSDVKNGKYHYCGGDRKHHHNYYMLMYGVGASFPPHKDRCICNHRIKENCYITDNVNIHVLGNCCIKRFLPRDKQGRTCEVCSEPHKNRRVNRCNVCKVKYCYDCDILLKNESYKRCYECHVKNVYK